MKYYYLVIHSKFNSSDALSYHEELDEALSVLNQLYEDQTKLELEVKVIHETKFITVDNENVVRDVFEIVIVPFFS